MDNSELLTGPASGRESLTGGRLLARNVIWNGASEVAPLIIALVSTPIVIYRLGTDRFGVLALAWMVFGFFAFFDLGLGSAITKLVSDRLAAGREDEVPTLVRTCLLMLLGVGFVALIVLAAICPRLVHVYLKIPLDLQPETQRAFYLIAVSVPVVLSARTFYGMLSAYQRFDVIGTIQSIKAIFLSLAPLAVVLFSRDLVVIFSVLGIGHVIFWAAYFVMCRRVLPGLTRSISVDLGSARALVGFGGWAAGGGVAALVMNSLDRSVLAAMVGMNAVAYFAVPQRVVARLRIVPQIFGGVLFPAFAHSLGEDRDRTILLFDRGLKSVIVLLFPAALLVVVFAPELLGWWLGPEFAKHSAPVLRWLALSAVLGGMGELPGTLLGAAHRPDISTKILTLQVVPYLLLLRWCVGAYGVEGAAIALAIRLAVETVLLLGIAQLLLPDVAPVARRFSLVMVGGLLALLLGMRGGDLLGKSLFSVGCITTFLLVGWFRLCAPEERVIVRQYLRTLMASLA